MASLLLPIIYLSFISLGLPDALLGASWPTMHVQFGVPVSYAGIVSIIVCIGTTCSSLLSDCLTRRFGTGKITAISVALTACALFGFSTSSRYWMLLLWAVPYGLGAGGVDASINNYVALHYASRHMSWLHCMWGVGASIGPYILGFALSRDQGWNMGYAYIAMIQAVLTAVLFLSIPIWKRRDIQTVQANGEKTAALSLREILAMNGVKEILLAFFCYCALEATTGLWASTYMVEHLAMREETAARLASMFYLGITAGRALSGFMTYKFNDTNMIRIGQSVILIGIVIMLLNLSDTGTVMGILLVGLGCAPVYPSVIHSTPAHFGEENSQAVIGVQMASACIGSMIMPPIFGLMVNHISAALLPWYLGVILMVMILMCEKLNKKCPV